MRKQELTLKVVEALEKLYSDAKCSLTYTDAFQLLIATRLSAQCTDARVNIVTPALFSAFPTAQAMANADLTKVEELIKTCGLYKTKAKDLIGIGKMITDNYGGVVPDTIEELTKLPGVGRKTANLICGDIYGKPAVVTDTHFIRLCNRLGLVNTKDPKKVEDAMRKLLPPEKSSDFCHRTVLFGRDICTARKANCDSCPLNDFCPKILK
ncbi:MAG TPA: endonuclease III [Ruminococcaceae bacterium]|nr:endonuclease III [Oscillospiraceae bacterium]